LFFPETAGLTLEEIAQNFGEEVAVNLTGATDEEKARLDQQLATGGNLQSSVSSELENGTKRSSTNEAEQNVPKAG
jgi:(p)ppGpp synthase/HD superfamily hydrolase